MIQVKSKEEAIEWLMGSDAPPQSYAAPQGLYVSISVAAPGARGKH